MNTLQKSILRLLLCFSCLVPLTLNGQDAKTNQEEDEADVKAAVEDFLAALGNDDLERVKEMFLPDANIASITLQDGEPRIFTTSAEEYISQREGKHRKFREPVRAYSVNISQGLLAFVRADATVFYEGVASHHTNDFFVLMKDRGTWKILSGSYTTLPLGEGEQ